MRKFNRRRFLILPLSLVALFCWCLPAARLCAAEAEKPVAKGARLLGINVTQAEDRKYDGAMAQAKSAGMQVVSLKLDWDDVEKSPGVFKSSAPKISNVFYPPQHIQVSLRIATLDTNRNRIPADLRDKPFDSPEAIARFNQLLDWIFSEMPDVTLSELSIGNEVDGVLGADAEKWRQYTAFFTATREHARKLRGGLKVGVSIMFGGHTGKAASLHDAICALSDVVMVSYYPLTPAFKVREPKKVRDDFDTLCKRYPNRPVSFVEAGYPSGSHCDSSDAKQGQFVDELFAAWDQHAGQVQCVMFVWLHDVSTSAVEDFKKYYGSANPAFADYLGTLGLRTSKGAGSDKPAFTALRQQARARGWQ